MASRGRLWAYVAWLALQGFTMVVAFATGPYWVGVLLAIAFVLVAVLVVNEARSSGSSPSTPVDPR